MTELSASTTLSIDNISLSINAQHNKKMQTTILYIAFSTKQEALLSLLLQKYKAEKCLVCGINSNNGIYSAIPGKTSIVLIIPENKITQNITLLFAYLNKTKLTSQQAKPLGSFNYDTLAKDIRSITVTVTGKCKNFIAAVNGKTPKIDRLLSALKIAGNARDRDSGEGKNEETGFEFSCKIPSGINKNTVALYLSIVLGEIPCEFDVKNDSVNVKVLSGHECGESVYNVLNFKDVFQGKIKSFLTQTGSPGSPSANDKNGAEWKKKCEYILECENMLADIYAGVRGFSYSFKSIDEIKRVDSKAIAVVKSVKIGH